MAGKRDDLEIVIGADLNGLASDLSRAAQMTKALARDVEKNAPRTKGFAPQIATGGFRRAEFAARSAGASVRSLGADLVGLAAKGGAAAAGFLAVTAGGAGLVDMFNQVKGSVVMAAEFEQNQIAFEAMLGSAERAAVAMDALRNFAAETPFSSKEVTESARQLLAYGVAAEDLIPTLKVLGTVASGGRTPLKDEVYRYGTVRVAGHAMQQDLNQYTGVGHDVLPGIAKALKIDQSQVRKYTEETRVDTAALNSSLEDLANVKYAGLLERQANSLKGAWEQMTDSFDRAKLKLGQVIVREMGFKDAAKGAETFGNKLEKFIDGPLVTGGIRLLGDFGNALAHVTSEFASASFNAADIFGDMASQVPELKGTLDRVKDIVQGLKEFKIDPKAVSDFATEASKDFLKLSASLVLGVGEMGAKFNEEVLKPTKEAIRDIKEIWGNAKDVYNVVSGRGINRAIGDHFALGINPSGSAKAAFGVVPPERPKDDSLDDTLAALRRFAKTLNESSDRIDRIALERERKADEDFIRMNINAEIARAKRLSEENRRLANFERGDVGQLTGIGGFNPLHGLAAGMGGFQNQFDVLNSGLGAASVAKGVTDSGRVLRLPPPVGAPPKDMELARKVKEEFNPLEKLNRDLADLDRVFKGGLINRDQFDFARNKEVRGVADGLNIGGPAKLPDTVLAGSEADARLLAQAMAGGMGKQTTDDLLKMIEQHLRSIRQSNADMERAPVPKPVSFFPPF